MQPGASAGPSAAIERRPGSSRSSLRQDVGGKTCDAFAPLGPVIVRDIAPEDLRVYCRLDGDTRQDDRTSNQICPSPELPPPISLRMTHHSGDGIATGSLPGPGPI
ncbi:fumarylacetoacetate hydrolase family protein [Sphingomonas solaris]|uniref:Fumarylacetoacetase-like C-terminal domain-containing protein n=1 Tax=Alterirhizorhabdus solaris TaxID=2529389 RepID=A0A558QX08_9SPHN|nr:fumarylacetoacetate hydrolase family protein [Sphingomonas solaris]TVV71706.1 hypothetical protein FOY91_16160 [Sphingomonas solaris]